MYVLRIIYQYFEENYFSSSLNANYENLHFTKTATTLLMLVGGLSLGLLIACFAAVFERRVVGKFVRGILAKGAEDPETAVSLADLGLENNVFVKREMSRLGLSRKLVSIVEEDGTVRDYESDLIAAFPEYAEEIAQERGASFAEKTAAYKAKRLAEGEVTEEDSLVPEADRETGEKDAQKQKKSFFTTKFKPRAIDFATSRFFIPESLRLRAELRTREKGSSPWVLVIATVLVLLLFFLALRFIPAFVGLLDASISNFKGN